MDILLRQVTVIDPSSPLHQQKTDLLIRNGVIAESGSINVGADAVVDQPGLMISPGWTEIFSHFCDPGFEYRETLESGAQSAVAGGFTDVFVLPNTSPVMHHKSSVEYIVQKSRHLPVSIHPIAAITKNTEGKELSEMYDMHRSGAVAFSDGTATVQSAGMLLKALQYVRAIDGIIIQVPDDRSLSGSGLMHEGIVSTRMGLPGKPPIAEELMITRDIELARYTGSRIHFTGISSARSLELIRAARKEGVSVTCSVTPHHLTFYDEDLAGYDTHFKVNPPLRTAADRDALRRAVLDGTVDCITAHHMPHHTDHKIVEFEYAKDGIIGLETAFGGVRTAVPELTMDQWVSLIAVGPRKIFGLPPASIRVGSPATATIFSPEELWTGDRFLSLSGNSPFYGKELRGRASGIINKDRLFLRN